MTERSRLWAMASGFARNSFLTAAVCAVLGLSLFLTSFLRGWTHTETDFPNYYTAAVLTLQHQPVRKFYDWVWFQRQINYAGTEGQLGGYIPQTPLTMLPMEPIAGLAPQHAKQVWLLFGLLCMGVSVWMVSRLTGFRVLPVLLLLLLAYGSLASNLLLGQYYLFLMLLLTVSVWCLLRGWRFTGGAILGLVFALKLYAAPFFLYFLFRRQWRPLSGMIASTAGLGLLAIMLFGIGDSWYFVTTVMARGLDGSVIDPYHPFLGSMATFLRHTFVAEPELNPHPAITAPAAFFFLRAFYTLGVLAATLVAVRRAACDEGESLAWFMVMLFALSPNTASYSFVLLFVPVALLLRNASVGWAVGLLAVYAALETPLQTWDAWLFPKVWLLLALWLCVGARFFQSVSRPWAVGAVVCVAMIAGADGWRRWRSYLDESPRKATHVAAGPANLFASQPVINSSSMVYDAIDRDRYALHSSGAAGDLRFAFEGESFHPAIPETGDLIYFELVSHGHSRICIFDTRKRTLDTLVGPELDPMEPAVSRDGTVVAFVSRGSLYVRKSGQVSVLAAPAEASHPAFFPDGDQIVFAEGRDGRRRIRAVSLRDGKTRTLVDRGDDFDPAISPDGKLVAYAESQPGATQVWIEELASGRRWRVTSGVCNNGSPAWREDSRSVVFATDCDRGLGLTALYSVEVRASAGQ